MIKNGKGRHSTELLLHSLTDFRIDIYIYTVLNIDYCLFVANLRSISNRLEGKSHGWACVASPATHSALLLSHLLFGPLDRVCHLLSRLPKYFVFFRRAQAASKRRVSRPGLDIINVTEPSRTLCLSPTRHLAEKAPAQNV